MSDSSSSDVPFVPEGKRIFVLVAAILASAMGFIDGSVTSIATPAIRNTLDASLGDAQWVSNAYLLTLSSLLLLGGAASDRFGLRNVFAAGIAVFVLASIGSALAPTAGWLIAARAVQGIGQQVGHVVDRQRGEDDFRDVDAGPPQRVQPQHQGVVGPDFVVPIGADQQQMAHLAVGDHAFQDAQRRRIQPLQVVYGDQHRAFGGESVQDCDKRRRHRALVGAVGVVTTTQQRGVQTLALGGGQVRPCRVVDAA